MIIPTFKCAEFRKTLEKASKRIEGIDWTIGESYQKVFQHYMEDGENSGWINMTHDVCDVTLTLPDSNGWDLLATVVEGAMFVTDQSKKLELANGHGADYKICDACKHPQWKKSFIVKNQETGEELQVGSECARKFGIGLVSKIHGLAHELYENFFLCGCDDEERPHWRENFSDPHAVKSVETSLMVQAAKAYYDEHDGVWIKGKWIGEGLWAQYVPSESAADIRTLVESKKFAPNDDDEYYKSLCEYLNNEFVADDEEGFSYRIKCVGSNYYMSMGDSAVAFFAIKRFEQYKKERDAAALGIYLPQRNHYIRIIGKVVNSEKKDGYFGQYTEYEILNEFDGNHYIRAGVVNADENGHVEGYAFVDDVYNGVYRLARVTKNPKKGIALNNIINK